MNVALKYFIKVSQARCG